MNPPLTQKGLLPMGASIVIVEDDLDIADMVVRTLSRAGHDLKHVATGTSAVATIARTGPDLVLLDLGLPDIDGLQVCQQIRAAGYTGGMIVVTARNSPEDITASLEAGANDFLTKPFGLAELRARVTDVIRRDGQRPADEIATASGLTIRTATREAHSGPTPLRLTDTELDTLALLASVPGTAVPTHHLLTRVWGEATPARERALAATLKQLQRKLDAAGATDRVTLRAGAVTLDTRAG